jgi:hypothetical protein
MTRRRLFRCLGGAARTRRRRWHLLDFNDELRGGVTAGRIWKIKETGPAFRQAHLRGFQKEGILEGDWRRGLISETFNKDGTPFFGGP